MRLLPAIAFLLGVAACGFNPSDNPADDDAGTSIDAVDVDACLATAETCEGTDQDCDGQIDEGLTTGAPCDGPDTDTCPDDMTICNSTGAVVCGDTSGDDDVELCNGLDDNCNGATDEGFNVGANCDGADGDACNEGTFGCAGDGLTAVCSDNTGTIPEVCDGDDDDCDTLIDDGFDFLGDEANCGDCGNVCMQVLGTNTCTQGACAPSCINGAAECDGDPDNGCELQNTNPTCNPTSTSIIIVNGDATDTETFTGSAETIQRVRIRESNGAGDIDITARIALTSGQGANYDLYVHCRGCTNQPLTDGDNTIEVGREDGAMDRDIELWVEVRYNGTTPSTSCAQWSVTITGNVATANRCGDPPSGGGGGP